MRCDPRLGFCWLCALIRRIRDRAVTLKPFGQFALCTYCILQSFFAETLHSLAATSARELLGLLLPARCRPGPICRLTTTTLTDTPSFVTPFPPANTFPPVAQATLLRGPSTQPINSKLYESAPLLIFAYYFFHFLCEHLYPFSVLSLHPTSSLATKYSSPEVLTLSCARRVLVPIGFTSPESSPAPPLPQPGVWAKSPSTMS